MKPADAPLTLKLADKTACTALGEAESKLIAAIAKELDIFKGGDMAAVKEYLNNMPRETPERDVGDIPCLCGCPPEHKIRKR